MTEEQTVTTFREPLYACGMDEPCGAAVPRSQREAHVAWHRHAADLEARLERLEQAPPVEPLGDVAEPGVPIEPWSAGDEQPAADAPAGDVGDIFGRRRFGA